MIYENILKTIGNTPVVKMKSDENSADIYAKLEFFNPAGSVKDRAAYYMLKDVPKNSIIVEPTSGNTGIGVSMICASLGLKSIMVMPETMSIERRKIMKAYGAELILTEGKLGMKGAIAKAEEISKSENHVMLSQFCNDQNVNAHIQTTAVEIINDFDDLDCFVAGIGTGGTITGNSKKLKEAFSNIKIIGVEPEASPFLTQNTAGPHKIQGIGAGFKPEILKLENVDKIETVTNEDAFEYARMSGVLNGVLLGISGGAAYKVATDYAKKLGKGKKVLFIAPDNGERYLSTELYEV